VSRRLRAPAMSGGTNNAPEQRFPAELEAHIRAYLSENSAAAAEPSPLAYLTLRNYGRTDLIEPIMNNGGYIAVSRALGIRVDNTYSTYRPPRRPEELPSMFSKADGAGTLALGAGLDQRLNVDVASIKPMPPLVPETATVSGNEAYVSVRSGELPYIPEPVPTAEEVAAIGRDIVIVVDDVVEEGERLALTPLMRVGTLLLVVTAALGYGRASSGLLESGVLEALRAGSAALAVGHALLAVYAAAVVAPKFKRSAAVWGLKVLLSGPAGISSLKQYGPLRRETDAGS
jgi:hypothetical protein